MSDDKQNSETDTKPSGAAAASESYSNITSGSVSKSSDVSDADADSLKSQATDDKMSKPAPKKTTRHHKKRHIPWIPVFAIILILGLGAGNYWQFQQGRQLNQLVERISEQQSGLDNQLSAIDNNVSQLQDQQKSLTSKTDRTEAEQRTLISTLDQMSQQLKSMATAKGKEPLFWRVSEVEYLLTVANHRLKLERDVITAKTALQDADNRLRVIADPGLIPVREKISQEINQLNSVTLPDIPGMAAQLSGVIEGLDQLSFVKKITSMDSQSVPESEKEFQGIGNFIKTVWRDLVDGLFKIQRNDQPIEPLLPPEEKIYLVYNLELRLEQARLALLKRDSALFRLNLADVEQWVGNYFDRESTPVTNLLQTVGQLKQVELRPQLPDISASLRELRSWLEKQQQNTAARHVKNAKQLAQFPVETNYP